MRMVMTRLSSLSIATIMYATPSPSSLAPNVSRETFARLEEYVALLLKWNGTINLIGDSTADTVWQRHIDDSLQLLPLLPQDAENLVDFGSGAGLPGIVIALAAPTLSVTLVERDQRKAAFLQEALSRLAIRNATIVNDGIENCRGRFDIVTARALAPLDVLFDWALPRLTDQGLCLFLKGRQYEDEIAAAKKDWQFDVEAAPSKTEAGAAILTIKKLSINPNNKR